MSCQAGGDPDPTATPATATEMVATSTPALQMRRVVWTTGVDSSTNEPIDRVEIFPRDTETIYAALEVMNVPEGGSLTATWEINGLLVEGLESTIELGEAQQSGWVEFHLDWDGPTMWPTGTLTIVIASDAGDTVESSVRIE